MQSMPSRSPADIKHFNLYELISSYTSVLISFPDKIWSSFKLPLLKQAIKDFLTKPVFSKLIQCFVGFSRLSLRFSTSILSMYYFYLPVYKPCVSPENVNVIVARYYSQQCTLEIISANCTFVLHSYTRMTNPYLLHTFVTYISLKIIRDIIVISDFIFRFFQFFSSPRY